MPPKLSPNEDLRRKIQDYSSNAPNAYLANASSLIDAVEDIFKTVTPANLSLLQQAIIDEENGRIERLEYLILILRRITQWGAENGGCYVNSMSYTWTCH